MTTHGPRPRTTLTEDQKRKAVELRAKGMGYAELRERFRCSQSTLARAIKEVTE